MRKGYKPSLFYALSIAVLAILAGLLLYQALFTSSPRLSQPPYEFFFQRTGKDIRFEVTIVNNEDVGRTYTFAIDFRWDQGDVEHSKSAHHSVHVRPGETVSGTLHTIGPADLDVWTTVSISRDGELIAEKSSLLKAPPT